MTVLVVYESKHDRTRQVAESIADAAASHDIATLVRTFDEATPSQVSSVTAVVAGCTAPGDTPFGGDHSQGIVDWINDLDPLDGKLIGVYCTYKFFPHTFADTTRRVAHTLDELSERFERKGGVVAATQGINLKALDNGATELVDQLADQRDVS
jgi:flavodoxin